MAVTLSSAIRRTKQELVDAEQRTEALRQRLKALEEAAQELDGEEGRRLRDENAIEPRTDAILAVMHTQPTVAWTTAMLKPLVGERRGTVEQTKDLAAALSYLGQQRKVQSLARGEWMVAGHILGLETLPADPDPWSDVDAADIPF